MQDWPWQERGLKEVLDLLGRGQLSICVTSPTGMGKGRMIENLCMHFLNMGGRVILFTDRRMLTKQTGDRFRTAGIHFGYASAEHGMDLHMNMIVASLQTVRSRVKRLTMELPLSDLVIIDEAHKRGFDFMLDAYRTTHPGVAVVGFTASPVGLKGKYEHLVVAGTKPEGREGNALVPCRVIGMPEPDMTGVKMNKVGEYIHEGMVKRVMECTVFADIFDCWKQNAVVQHLGADGFRSSTRPTIVWAPGVPESKWIVEEFQRLGISAAHIDGETDEAERVRIRAGSLDGSIKVVSSFGVLREGVDWPWLSYGILIQVCGAYETFVQLVGRILRRFPGKTDAILQDHSGTWWRHGSPNFDRAWSLEDTNKSIAEERKAKPPKADGEAAEGDGGDTAPICCPKCHGIRVSGPVCPHCGYRHTGSVRMIRKQDGTLVEMKPETAKKPKKDRTETEVQWGKMMFMCGCTGKTFAQAAAIFHQKTGKTAYGNNECHPKPEHGSPDWQRKVADIYPKFNRRGKVAA